MQLRKNIARLRPLRHFLRAIGLELIPALVRPWNEPEEPKPVIRHSFWVAFSRCTIHLMPCTIFALLLYLNYSAMYIGSGFVLSLPDAFILALFQVAAKLLEILCVASLTAVVLQFLRHELINEGVPLSLVGSGIYFSQANCLWSPEILVSVAECFKDWRYLHNSWRRARLLIVIAIAALLAVLLAPSAAVLLLPRLQNVPAGGTDYYLPATADQLWPSVLDGSDEPQACFDGNTTHQVFCASGGFESLRSCFGVFNSSFTIPPRVLGSSYFLNPVVVKSSAPQLPDLQNYGSGRGWRAETELNQPNMATSILPSSLTWRESAKEWSGSPFSPARQYQYALRTLSIVSTTSPKVRIRCTEAQNVSTGLAEVEFPIKTWRATPRSDGGTGSWQNDGRDVKPFNVSVQNSKTRDRMHIEWVALPSGIFGPVSGGILLQFPGHLSNHTAAVVGCSVGAAWFQREIRSDSNAYGAAWDFNEDPSGAMYDRSIRDDLNASSPQSKDHLRSITIRDRWFDSLNSIRSPNTSVDSSPPLTSLQQIFSEVGLSSILVGLRTRQYNQWNPEDNSCCYRPPNLTLTDTDRLGDTSCNNGGKTSLIELILASTIVNGLSRYGSRLLFEPESLEPNVDKFHWTLKDTPKAKNFAKALISNAPHSNAMVPAPPGSDFVTLHLRFEVNGYAWYASSASDYLATAVICLYVLIALAHTAWILTHRDTSSSWDTVTELLALALQSPVATNLFGSGAGIERVNTYKTMIRLRAVRDEDLKRQGVDERLALVVEVKNGSEGKKSSDTVEQLSDGLKQTTIITTALTTPSVSSTIARSRSQETHKEPYATYTRVETEKKYL